MNKFSGFTNSHPWPLGRGSIRLVSALVSAFILTACGDDITEINANVGAVATSDDLPGCTESIAGQTAFIKETHEFLGCDGKEWQTLSANTVSVGDNVCTSTSLSDGTGFEIFCNGQSIGMVKNGKDGVNGKDGEPGAAGKDGEPGEKGEKGDTGDKGADGTNGKDGAPGTNGTNGTNGKDGTPGANGTGCSIQESTALTATIACGSETFTMDLTGYVEIPEECDASQSEDCTGSLENVNLSGVSQKGPFAVGADITAYELQNGRSLKQTGKTFSGKIEKADGSFDVKTVKLASTFAYIVADGFYRNEVTGEKSATSIKLRALTNLIGGRKTANINLVTHLEYDRVVHYVTKEDSLVKNAKKAAEKDIFNAFYINSDGFTGYAEDYNVLEEGDGNAALLAISVMLQGDRTEAELSSLLASLSVDLGDNGEWDNRRERAQIADWAMKKTFSKEGLAAIRKNVEGWGLSTSKAPAFEKHVINFWQEELGYGECSSSNENAIKAAGNKYSTYYAQKDSVTSEGDRSNVRLICAADGDSYAWRIATDIEKNTASLTGPSEGMTTRGSIDTLNVYVYEDGVWRAGTELDINLNSCVASKAGAMAKLTVKNDTTWYVCDTNPSAWRTATTAEADTAGFGTPAEGDPIVRMGNVNKSLFYVYEDTSGNGDYVWRYGTDLDYGLGACNKDGLGNLGKLPGVEGPNAWYICVGDEYVLVEGVRVPTVWRKATTIEMDTYKWPKDTTDGTLMKGESGQKYVFDNHSWRFATDLEKSELGACTEAQNNVVKQKGEPPTDTWYKCTGENSTFVDNFEVKYTWRLATNLEKDTLGWSRNVAEGTVKNGKINNTMTYVFENGAWRHGTTLDSILRKGCIQSRKNELLLYKSIDWYVCIGDTSVSFEESSWTSAWRRAMDVDRDLIYFEAHMNSNGTILTGPASGAKRVWDGGSLREPTSRELIFNRACVTEMYDEQFELTNGFVYTCTSSGWPKTFVFTDSRDQKTYKGVEIGTQIWMGENLNYKSNSGSSCYDTRDEKCATYGRLYRWRTDYCPSDWHLPTQDEYLKLFASVGGDSVANTVLRSEEWYGTDDYGFSALPGGLKNQSLSPMGLGKNAYFWTATTKTVSLATYGCYMDLPYDRSVPAKVSDYFLAEEYGQGYSLSIRCVFDISVPEALKPVN